MTTGPRETAVVLLTQRPDPGQVAFLAGMAVQGYDLFAVADDPAAAPLAPPLTLLHPADAACEAAGFVDLNPFITRRKRPARVSAWERGLYAFAVADRRHGHVWFVEEDVFIPTLDTLARIDDRHGAADILSDARIVSPEGDRSSWGWYRHVPEDILPPPWAWSMVCAVRLSRRLLDLVRDLLARHPELAPHPDGTPRHFFIEYLFHILALHHGLAAVAAPELRGVLFRHAWSAEEMLPGRLYHPVKDLVLQATWRARLDALAGPA